MYKSSSNEWLVKYFDSNKTISFKVSDNKLLKKYNKIKENIIYVICYH